MTLRHMRIFLAVCANQCNTTKAAAALHMTQPAVSLAVRELEQYYGVVLFDRIGRHLVLTELGRRFADHALQITGQVDDMERELQNWDRLGLLRVGASITIGAQFLPDYISAFSQRHPGAEIRVTVGSSEVLERKFQENALDFALMEGIPHLPSLVAEAYLDDHLTVICSPESGFSPGQVLSLDVFQRQRFLLRETGSGTREEFDHAMELLGIAVDPLWESVSTTALVKAVMHGLGISVLPFRMVQDALARGDVISVEVAGLEFRRNFRIVRHKKKFLTPLAQDFIQLCREFSKTPAPVPSAAPC